ncbi:MAG TPA: hypothetical protein PLS51_02900 [Flavobacterium sp.]|nr:hypothetical protein [Flavobacterium sp.]HPJ09551.1 hypothetical protein [Flavobacterium sp.]
MKKTTLLCFMILLLGSCKKKETPTNDLPQGILSTESATATTDDCSFFDPLDSLDTADQVKWLRDNQNEACLPQYDQCRENVHKISQAVYQQALQEYWGAVEVVTTEIRLGDIEALSNQSEYVQFIAAEINGNKVVKLMATDNFTQSPTCYSVPLFYSIQRLHELTAESVLVFTAGKKDGKEVILFGVKGTSDYYDVSSAPM